MLQIVAIVGGDQRDSRFAREADDFRIDLLLDFQSLVLNLQEEIPFSKDVAQAISGFARLIRLFFHQILGNGSAQACRQRNQTTAVLRQQVIVDARLVIKTFEVSRRDQLDQIAVAFRAFAQQHQVIRAALPWFGRVSVGGIALRRLAAIVAAALGHIHFAPDDRLDAARLGGVVEGLRGKKISVVGDGHCGHLAARRFIDDLFKVARPIQQTVVRVQMQVNESRSFHAGRYSNLARKILLIRD